jgi:hypothetical protein
MVQARASFLAGMHVGLVIAAGAFLAGAVITLRGVE